MIIIDLIYNLAVLVALSVLSGFIDSRFDRKKYSGQILQGILFGITAIIGMLYPFVLVKGIIFDGRSIVISLATLFFGPLTGLISSTMAIAFRVYLGGGGALTGVLVVTASFLIGYLFYVLLDKKILRRRKIVLYLFGFVVSAVMMALMTTLPTPSVKEAYNTITLTVMVFYPLITLLIGKVLLDQRENKFFLERINVEKTLYKTTLYSIGDAVITTDKNGLIKNLNPVAEALTGWKETDALGQPLENVFRIINEENLEAVENPVKKVLREGLVVGLANHTLLVSKNGNKIPIADSGAPIRNNKGEVDGVVLVFRDQTVERQMQRELEASEYFIRSVMDNLPIGISVNSVTPPLTFSYINDNFVKFYRTTKEALAKPDNFWSAVYENPSFREEIKKKILEDCASGDPNKMYWDEIPITRKGEETSYVTARNIPIPGTDLMISTVWDVTERKRAKDEIIYLNRLYAMLSETNQAIVRLKDKEQLFKHICSIAIDYGVFEFAWIGLYSPEKKRIEPHTWAGVEDWFEAIRFSEMPDEIYALTPCARAFAENKIVIIEDVAASTGYEYWRQLALDRNFRSIAATPLQMNKNVIGVFVIYSAEKNFFGPKETQLLEEIGTDISFALETYEKEEIHRQVEKEKALLNYTIEQSINEIFIFGAATLKFRYANSGAIKNLGYSLEELKKMTPLDIKPEFTLESFNKLTEPLINSEKEFVFFETCHRRKDASIYPCEVRLQLFDYENDRVFLAIIEDITERKKAEEALRESEAKFRSLFENHSAVKLIIEPKTGQIVNANAAAAEYYGWSVDELRKMNLSQINLLPPDKLKVEMERVLRLQKTYFEMRHRKADGSIRDVEVYSSKVVIGGKDYLHSIIHDITEKKIAETQLLLLSRSVEQSPISVVITNPHGIIEYANPKFTEVTGYELEEVVGKNPRILQSGHHQKEFFKELWDTILSKKDFRGEILNRKKNGELFWERAVISPIMNNEGEITHFVAIKEDITERKKMLHELIVAKEKAEESDRLKSEFLAQMSHEIRTPVHIVTSSLAFIKEDLADKFTEEDKELFDNIALSVKRIIRTIDLILNASELQLGIYKPNYSPIDLDTSLLFNVIAEHKPLAEKKNLALIFTKQAPFTKIIADEYCVVQIFANLVDNAIKYTRAGKVEVVLLNDKEMNVIVEVRDTGIGMSKDFLKRLFEPFMQEEQGYTRSYEGNGLGLALVKKYCELNNAAIEVESEKGVGSVFRVIFKNNGNETFEKQIPLIS